MSAGSGGFLAGAGYVLRGLRWTGGHRRWWLFGLIPALIALVLYVAALAALAAYADDLAGWITPFADDWSSGMRGAFRTAVALLIFVGGLFLSILTFTALTLTIGDPFYEKLGEAVEISSGGLPEGPDIGLWRGLVRSTGDSLVTLAYALAFALPLFVLGFVPVIGQSVVPVLGALVSGFFLAIELTALPLERRGLDRRARFRLLRANKGLAMGFGTLIFIFFLVPLVAVAIMPGAVAGATLLARERLAPVPVDNT